MQLIVQTLMPLTLCTNFSIMSVTEICSFRSIDLGTALPIIKFFEKTKNGAVTRNDIAQNIEL